MGTHFYFLQMVAKTYEWVLVARSALLTETKRLSFFQQLFSEYQ